MEATKVRALLTICPFLLISIINRSQSKRVFSWSFCRRQPVELRRCAEFGSEGCQHLNASRRLSSVHFCAPNKVDLRGMWRRGRLPSAGTFFGGSLQRKEATPGPDQRPGRADGGEDCLCRRGPSAAAGSASSVAQMLRWRGRGSPGAFPAVSGGVLGWLVPRHSPEEDSFFFFGCDFSHLCEVISSVQGGRLCLPKAGGRGG